MPVPQVPDILSNNTLTRSSLAEGSKDTLLQLYTWMKLARTADTRIENLFREGLIKGTCTGGQGNENLIVPLTLLADKSIDVISFTHRDLGGHLIWSGHLCDHLNQYLANDRSPTKAREGNVHHGDPANRSLPMVSHLGAMISNVAGRTHAQRKSGKNAVGFAIFGDGGTSTGDIHETLNLASLLNLPVLFVIENNGLAYSTPTSEQFASGTKLWKRAEAYNMEGRFIDTVANTPLEVARQLADAIESVRKNSRPILIEARTLRLGGHAAYDTRDYLMPAEIERTTLSDPLPRFVTALEEAGYGEDMERINQTLSNYIESSIQESLSYPHPTAETLPENAFAPDKAEIHWIPSVESDPSATEPKTLTMAQAINAALRKILTERPESLILGQDIATYGGAFKVTENLYRDFGRERVFNTPLAESACTGYATGLALGGYRPIEEFQFADFATEAVTQITQNAATYHFRSGARVPLVFRFPCGGGVTVGSFHSQELESIFLAFPGIKALYPSTPQDAFNATLAAYEDNNPVILFEHKGLYRRGKAPVSWDADYQRIWEPRRLAEGSHATLVTYGEMTLHALEAAAYFKEEYDMSFDVFDLRALSPLNLASIKESLVRTHRLVVIHEGHLTLGFGAELVARLTSEHFFDMEAPPLRIASKDIPVPFAPELEKTYRPGLDSIIEKIANWLQ